MRCPFLREAQVKSCRASAYRKMIVRTAAHAGNERCLTPEYRQCPAAKQLHEESPSQSHCPFLQESLVQYCSTAPVTKYIPYTESLLSRCMSGRHRYCELYLGMARPAGGGKHPAAEDVEGIEVPDRLYFSRNHLWLDLTDDGSYQIGIDGLLAHVLGPVDNVTFLSSRGTSRPSAVLTVQGVDLQIVFPNPVPLSGFNAYIRSNPERVAADPYGLGWLFEGTEAPLSDGSSPRVTEGLLHGAEAREWMRHDVHRMSAFIHEILARPGESGERVLNDGGVIVQGALRQLPHDDVFHFFNEFFSPYASLRR